MRGFLITVVLAVVIAGGVAYWLQLWTPSLDDPFNVDSGAAAQADKQEQKAAIELGARLYKAPKGWSPNVNPVSGKTMMTPDAIVVPGCRIGVIEKQTVSSAQDGMVLFIGKREMTPAAGADSITINLGAKKELISYRGWTKNAIVQPGEMVGYLDPAMAMREMEKAKRQISVAKHDHKSSIATFKEADTQYERIKALRKRSPSSVAIEEVSMKKLTRDRHEFDMKSKEEAIKVAENELAKAQIMFGKHEIRNMMKGVGVITEIYKYRGEAVRALEPVLELHNIEKLRAEGLIEEQYVKQINDLRRGVNGMSGREPRVRIEPVTEKARWRQWSGHRDEVTGVAFSKDPKAPLIISGSRDKTVRIWSLLHKTAIRILKHDAPVTVVACPPETAALNCCATACDDGRVSVWKLDAVAGGGKNSAKKMLLWTNSEYHVSGGVTALAFSPDGRYLASGGEDRDIVIRDAGTGKKLFNFSDEHRDGEAHEGAITALHFTPGAQLVTASRDKSVRVWNLHVDGARLALKISGRGGSVRRLGVSSDGRLMLFDRGRKLQMLSTADGNMFGEISSPNAATSFETLALFSPRGGLLLTAGAPDGRLQLWTTHVGEGRGIELQQWKTNEASPVTCAAFAPDAGGEKQSYAVSGCKNGIVYLWTVPGRTQIRDHAITGLKLDMVDRSLGSGNQVRFGVNVSNPRDTDHPYGKLLVGSQVTVVIEP